ncbi:MAG: hypothetical protein K2X91_16775 [Thermoleophilia bacterium]|nr:hypothetical protein [Thermoleophilia bacterium]
MRRTLPASGARETRRCEIIPGGAAFRGGAGHPGPEGYVRPPSGRALTVGVAVLVLLVSVVLAIALAGTSGDAAPRGDAGPSPPGAIPSLTRAEAARARMILEADPFVAGLTAGRRHAVIGPGVWHEGPRRLGAFFAVELARPADYRDAAIPVIPFDRERGRFAPPSAAVVQRFSGRDVGTLSVTIDLAGGRVADITPWGRITDPPPAWRDLPEPRGD